MGFRTEGALKLCEPEINEWKDFLRVPTNIYVFFSLENRELEKMLQAKKEVYRATFR